MRGALRGWRQDAVLVGVLPVLCWPALVGALVTRPAPLRVVLLGLLCLPVLVALRELYVAGRVRRVLRDPGARWTPYEAEVLRGRGMPPLLVLGGAGDGSGSGTAAGARAGAGTAAGAGDRDGGGRGGGRFVLTLGPLGRRVLPPRAWPGTRTRTDQASLRRPGLPPSAAEPDAPDPPEVGLVWLMGDPGRGAVVWVPHARELGRARGSWRRGAVRRRRPPR